MMVTSRSTDEVMNVVEPYEANHGAGTLTDDEAQTAAESIHARKKGGCKGAPRKTHQRPSQGLVDSVHPTKSLQSSGGDDSRALRRCRRN
jgi:hypothetical protein